MGVSPLVVREVTIVDSPIPAIDLEAEQLNAQTSVHMDATPSESMKCVCLLFQQGRQ